IPAHPRIARLLTAATYDGHVQAGAALAAILSEKDVFRNPDRERDREHALIFGRAGERGRSDLFPRLDLIRSANSGLPRPGGHGREIDQSAVRQTLRATNDLLRIARRLPGGRSEADREPDDDSVLRWTLLAFPDRVVRRRGNEATGIMVGGRGVRL